MSCFLNIKLQQKIEERDKNLFLYLNTLKMGEIIIESNYLLQNSLSRDRRLMLMVLL